jgi:hypothetical protein
MGLTGTADASDPANVFYNPANVLTQNGAYVNGAYRNVPSDFIDDLWFGAANAGVGYRVADGSDYYAFGCDVGWARFDYGSPILTDSLGAPVAGFHSMENYVSAALGAGVSFAGKYRLAAAFAVKRWWADYAPAGFVPGPDTAPLEPAATAFDLGTTFAVDFRAGEWLIAPAAGLAWANGGGDYDAGNGGTAPLPGRVTGGVSARLEGPSTTVYGTPVPAIVLTQNADRTDWSDGDRSTWGLGLEVAVLQIAFMRVGYYRDDEVDRSDSTWGVGIGLPAGAFRARFDYARYPDASGLRASSDAGAGMYNLSLAWLIP